MKQGGPLVSGAEAENIIEESAYDSNNEGPMNPQLMPQGAQQQMTSSQVRPHLQHNSGLGMKKKKGVPGKKKIKVGAAQPGSVGAVKTNNFMLGNDP